MLVLVGGICVPCSQTESFMLGLVGGFMYFLLSSLEKIRPQRLIVVV